MKFGPWFSRLDEAIERYARETGESPRAISMKAGLGPNFISQMRTDKKGPRADSVVKLASYIDVSLTWIFLGIEMDAEDERLLAFAAGLPPEQRKKIVDFLEALPTAPLALPER